MVAENTINICIRKLLKTTNEECLEYLSQLLRNAEKYLLDVNLVSYYFLINAFKHHLTQCSGFLLTIICLTLKHTPGGIFDPHSYLFIGISKTVHAIKMSFKNIYTMFFSYMYTKFECYILKQGTRLDLGSLGKKKYQQYSMLTKIMQRNNLPVKTTNCFHPKYSLAYFFSRAKPTLNFHLGRTSI